MKQRNGVSVADSRWGATAAPAFGGESLALGYERTPYADKIAKVWGGQPKEPLEKQMLQAATAEALSVAWYSRAPQQAFLDILESKLREAKAYVAQQRRVRGKADQLIASAF